MAKTGKGGIRWTVSPDNIAVELEAYGERVQKKLEADARELAQRMADYAAVHAPWTDRTGETRAGLQGIVDVDTESHLTTIFLAHGVEVPGIFLELSHGGKFAIIMPTINSFLPEIKALMQASLTPDD